MMGRRAISGQLAIYCRLFTCATHTFSPCSPLDAAPIPYYCRSRRVMGIQTAADMFPSPSPPKRPRTRLRFRALSCRRRALGRHDARHATGLLCISHVTREISSAHAARDFSISDGRHTSRPAGRWAANISFLHLMAGRDEMPSGRGAAR